MSDLAPELTVLVRSREGGGRCLRHCLEALERQTPATHRFDVVVAVERPGGGQLEALGDRRPTYPLTVERGDGALSRAAAAAAGDYCALVSEHLVPTPGFVAAHLRRQRQLGGAAVAGRLRLEAPPGADGLTRSLARDAELLAERLSSGAERLTPGCCRGSSLSFPRRSLAKAGGFGRKSPKGLEVELAHRLERGGLPLAYAHEAAASRELGPSFTRTAHELALDGAERAAVYRREPAALAELGLDFREATLPLLAARELLLRGRVPAGLFALCDPLVRRLPERGRVYDTLRSYFFWLGVRRELGGGRSWRSLRRGTVILLYHAIGRDGEPASRFVLPRRRFARQMRWLRWSGRRVLSLDDYVRAQRQQRSVPARSVVITFDDGYRDTHELAGPILEATGLPACVFLVTAEMGTAQRWSRDGALRGRPLMSWEQARRLAGRGLGLGAHTRTHPPLTAVSPERAASEIARSRSELEAQVGRPALHFAYPYGYTSAAVEGLVEEAGFVSACGLRQGANSLGTPRYALRRVEVEGSFSLGRFILALCTGFARR